MKHKVKGRKLSRIRKQRRALLKTLLGSLIMREKIITTEARAKEINPAVERIVRIAKKMKTEKGGKTTVIRELQKNIPNVAAKKMSGDFLNKFSERRSGYTRIIKKERRKSDGARMAVIEFV